MRTFNPLVGVVRWRVLRGGRGPEAGERGRKLGVKKKVRLREKNRQIHRLLGEGGGEKEKRI